MIKFIEDLQLQLSIGYPKMDKLIIKGGSEKLKMREEYIKSLVKKESE